MRSHPADDIYDIVTFNFTTRLLLAEGLWVDVVSHRPATSQGNSPFSCWIVHIIAFLKRCKLSGDSLVGKENWLKKSKTTAAGVSEHLWIQTTCTGFFRDTMCIPGFLRLHQGWGIFHSPHRNVQSKYCKYIQILQILPNTVRLFREACLICDIDQHLGDTTA